MKSKVTRKDVADKAGVSVSVVSRALNNSGYVEQDKKEKILRIAKELGYVPNPVLCRSNRKEPDRLFSIVRISIILSILECTLACYLKLKPEIMW